MQDYDEFVKQYKEQIATREREKQRDNYNKLMEKLAQENDVNEQKDQIVRSTLRKYEKEAKSNGEITNVFIKQHLEAKIIAARWMLGLGMAMTLLFKGQWFLWIIFIIIYLLYVRKIKAEALNSDTKKERTNERMD